MGSNIKKITLGFLLLLSVALYGQGMSEPYNVTLTLDDSTSVTDSIPLETDLVPVGLMTKDDSLKVASAVTFEISFGRADDRQWYTMCVKSDSTAYTVGIPTDTSYIPLDPAVFFGAVGQFGLFDVVWLRLRFTVKHDGDQHFIIRQRSL